jgi:DNA-binding Lrp family transcriptional regulator
MIHAIVLLEVNRDRINEVAQELAGMDGISEVYSVAGRWDLVAMLRAGGSEDLASQITEHLLKTPGIRRSETLIAFRVLSRYDLDRLFSVGLEE